MFNLINQVSNRRARRAARRGRPHGKAAGFAGLEPLEDRRLMSGSNPMELIDTSLTPTELAQSLVGAGVEVSNVTFTGGAASTGSFSFTDPTVIGFGQGILLSSGSAADVVGPNVLDDNSTDFILPGDADLDALSGFTTFDAAVLEFDFIPTANQVVFSYAFASDEYPEWVNSPFNDVFAFFVNGTNYAEVRQFAGDPASAFVPVAVNNINNGNALYPDFIPARPDLFRANYYNPAGASAIDLEMDGITKVLTFQAPVNPGVLNHMKLAIADASDGILDSAVFIQAGSLVSNENPVADLSLTPSQGAAPLAVTAIVEGEDPNGLPLTYTINWGDGTPDSSGPLNDPVGDEEKTALVEHIYTTGGSYYVTLTVSNGTLSGTSIEDVDVTGASGDLAVTNNPDDAIVFEGDLFTFTAAASGDPTPTVQWQVSIDGGDSFSDIDGATSTTYSAVATMADDGALYQAVFTNENGSVTTDAALLTVIPSDTTAPDAPGVALADDTGSSNTDHITMDGTLVLSGVEAGASVEYSSDGGESWSSAHVAVEGENTVMVRQTDGAGNISDATTFGFTLDTTAPAAPGVTLAQDTGSSPVDYLTNLGEVALTDVETGAAVEYSNDGGGSWTDSFTATEGDNSVMARQTDVAGNVGDAGALTFTLDLTPPTLSPTFSSPSPFLVGATGITVSGNAVDESGIASQTNGLVNTLTPGAKVVTCTATDHAGNSASADVAYVVGYGIINLLPAAGSTFKSTAAIPVSFQLVDANGLITDQAATNLRPFITAAFDGRSPVGVKYNKKTNTFSVSLKTSKPAPGFYDVTIRVTVGGVDVATAIIPVQVV